MGTGFGISRHASFCILGYGIGFICIIPVIFKHIHFDTMELKSNMFLVN